MLIVGVPDGRQWSIGVGDLVEAYDVQFKLSRMTIDGEGCIGRADAWMMFRPRLGVTSDWPMS